MDTLKLGQIITSEQHRDAIHIAVAPVTAKENLAPGQDVDAAGSTDGKAVGIVDPFLKARVRKGQVFWLFLYPYTITSLRHEWVHPAFDSLPEPPREEPRNAADESRKWIENFAREELDLTYNALMEAAADYLETGDRLVQHGSERWRNHFYPMAEEFWKHYEIVTGKKVEEPSANPFCCTC